MSRDVPIGLAQITGRQIAGDRNRALSVTAAEDLFARGAKLVVLPELIVPGYATDPERLRGLAEDVSGPTVSAWTDLAARHRGYVAGGFCERAGDRLFNTAVIVGPDGPVLHYRKLHLFRGEKAAFAAGDLGLPVVETELGRLAACICYDLRFVETIRILALKGAELVCVPTAWVPGFDTERWDRDGFCPQAKGALAQANLSQVFIACASQAGPGDGVEFLGSSVLAGPYGDVLLGPLSGDRDELAVATADVDAAGRAQQRDPLISPREERRTDVYGLTVDGAVL